ncbi:unnamed protein product, partial [Laminaria digitata]
INRGHCSYASCTKITSFNVDGSAMHACCKKHDEDGMVDVLTKHCSHESCIQPPCRGLSTNGVVTACSRHKSYILNGPVINFKAQCKSITCRKVSRLGINGK